MVRASHELDYAAMLEQHFVQCAGTHEEKMASFPRFVQRQQQAIYLFKYEIFRRVLNVHGSIAEFGVYMGSGLFSFASFSTILEPFNYQRRIVGFDTFEGFPDISANDLATAQHSKKAVKGGLFVDSRLHSDLKECVELFDRNRPIGHIPKIELVKGNVIETVPAYIRQNPHLMLSLLYLDLDLYEPTKFVLEQLYDRVVPGGIVAFDEVNNEEWPGETKAFLEFFKTVPAKLEKVPFEPVRCFFVKP